MARAVRKVAVKKTVKKIKTKKVVCPNCNDSGMTCIDCGVGRLQE